jgi:hypothetical protein
LREYPYSITPDTSFFFSSGTSQEALNTLIVAARMGEGLRQDHRARSAPARRCCAAS